MLAFSNVPAENKHPNVIKLFEIIDNDELDRLIIVEEFCSKGTLLNWNNKDFTFSPNNEFSSDNRYLTIHKVKSVLKQVASGLHFLHSRGVMHRDIKPQNVMFDKNGTAKIVDFGVSKVLENPNDSDTVKTTEGTYHFMSPEACDPDVDGFSGKAQDVWALGVTLYAMLFNKVPFFGQNEFQIMQNIREKPVEYP